MLKRHLSNLFPNFVYRITNATTEGFNSVIQALKCAARSFHSAGNYRTRILCFGGKLDLRPQLPCNCNPRKTQFLSPNHAAEEPLLQVDFIRAHH